VRALVVAPTRELAEQIHTAFCDYGRRTGLRCVAIYGGVGMSPQIQKLRQGVDIVVACPGRLLDHADQRTISLAHVEVLVLDEADRMFDMGFLPNIRKIVKLVPVKRQTLMFSATMPNDILLLARQVLHNPVTVQVRHTSPVDTVAHALYPVDQHLKTELLLELLKQTGSGSVLIFTRTKHRAKRLGQRLEKSGYRAASLQGDLSQNKRQAALDGFRDGQFQLLVATDIAARGIDVTGISHVINYDVPDTADAYTHRIGRTGRAAATGDAFTFVTREDEEMVRAIEKVLGSKVERRYLAEFDYKQKPPARETEFARPPREPRRQHGPRSEQRPPKPHANPPSHKPPEGVRTGQTPSTPARGPSRPRSFGPNRRGGTPRTSPGR
jgi:ATP-dependent RNA helicase RhlE